MKCLLPAVLLLLVLPASGCGPNASQNVAQDESTQASTAADGGEATGDSDGSAEATSPGETEAPPAGNADAGAEDAAQTPHADSPVTLKILDFEGIQKLVASHQGKVVVMDAWSTSCPPCVEEFPNLVKLHRQYGPEQVACISLSFDYEGLGSPEEVQGPVLEFLQAQGAAFDNVLSSVESDELYKLLNLAAVPAVYVYGRDGKLVKRFDNESGGEFTYKDVGALVAELVGAQASE